MTNNIQVITTGFEELLQEVKDSFITQGSKTLKILVDKLNIYLNELNVLVQEYNYQFNLIQSSFSSKSQTGGVAWKNFLNQKKNINNENYYLSLIKKGELLIEQIRSKLTGEETIVNIGIEYYGKLYEVKLKLSEALNMAKIGISSNGDIILKSGSSNLSKKTLVGMTNETNDSSSLLFSSIKKKSSNKGNSYEAYRNKINNINAGLSLTKLINKIKSNTTSGKFGGDVYYYENNKIISEQVKFYGSSQFSFLSLKTIQATLTVYLECFESFLNGDINDNTIQKLKKELIRTKITTRIEAVAAKKAEQTLDNYFKKLTK